VSNDPGLTRKPNESDSMYGCTKSLIKDGRWRPAVGLYDAPECRFRAIARLVNFTKEEKTC
jgi:hypothetical protein